jgi:hypothetical protein
VSDRPVPTARAAWRHAALVAALVALILLVAPQGAWRSAVELPVFLLGLGAVHTALRRHRTTGFVAWWGLGATLVLFSLSSAVEVPALAGVAPHVLGGLETTFDIAAYGALVVAALGQLAVGRRRRDREAWIDTAGLLLATGLAVLAFPRAPGTSQRTSRDSGSGSC